MKRLLAAVFTVLVGVSTAFAAKDLPDMRASFPDGTYVEAKLSVPCNNPKVRAAINKSFADAAKTPEGREALKQMPSAADIYKSAVYAEAKLDANKPAVKGCAFPTEGGTVVFLDGKGHAVIPAFMFEEQVKIKM